MAERAVFLDRDNTIIDNDGYLGDPSKVRLLTGAATALASLRSLGYRLIVVSNQSGVARGMFTEADVEAVNQEMCRQLREQAGAHIDASYYCPYHPESKIAEYRMDHDWRKPKAGMLKQAATDFGLDLSQCWTVGDMPRDIAAGALAGTRTILLRDPERPAPEHETNAMDVSPNFIVRTLSDAARIIAREGAAMRRDPVPAVLQVEGSKPAAATGQAAAVVPVAAAAGREEIKKDAGDVAGVDTGVLAAKVAEIVSKKMQTQPAAGVSGKTDKLLEELVTQLRQQNRHADLREEFSRGKLAAIVVQVLALACFLAGMVTMLGAPEDLNKWYTAVTGLLRAVVWMTGAVVLQGVVVAVLVGSRGK